MKIAKRIDITSHHNPNVMDAALSATLLVDSEAGTSGWILHIKQNGKTIRAEASSSTVLALMMAERDFQAKSTGFYEVDKNE